MKVRSLWKRAAIGAGALMAVTLLSGATYERVMRYRAWRSIDMPGRRILVETGRYLQLDCRGKGSPTVVLESGLDPYGPLAWSSVHDSLARTTRTCAYSRPGIMWSDPAKGPFDARALAQDLHSALINAGESAPWILVGHSIGGAFITMFTHMHQSEVAGLVYVDPSHPDQFARFQEVTGKSIVPSPTLVQVGSLLAWTGLVRLLPSEPSPAQWPRQIDAVAPAFLPTSVDELRREVEGIPSILHSVDTLRALGDRPVVVLTATVGPSTEAIRTMGITPTQAAQLALVSQRLHADMASWSSRGEHEVVGGASHYIQFDRPDVVIRSVGRMVTSVRARSSAAQRPPAAIASTLTPVSAHASPM